MIKIKQRIKPVYLYLFSDFLRFSRFMFCIFHFFNFFHFFQIEIHRVPRPWGKSFLRKKKVEDDKNCVEVLKPKKRPMIICQ